MTTRPAFYIILGFIVGLLTKVVIHRIREKRHRTGMTPFGWLMVAASPRSWRPTTRAAGRWKAAW